MGANLVAGIEEYRRLFGAQTWTANGRESTSNLPFAIEGFFQNGAKRCLVARVAGQGAAGAGLELAGGGAATSEARPASPSTDDDDDEARSREGDPSATGGGGGGEGGGAPRPASGRVLRVAAVGPGQWGNRIFVTVSPSSFGEKAPERFRLSIVYRDASDRDVLQEVFDDLSPSPDSPAYFERRVNGASSLVTLARIEGAPSPGRPANSPPRRGNEPPGTPLSGGRDGAPPTLEDFNGPDNRPGNRTGLGALGGIDEISILCAPDDQTVDGLSAAVVEQCERLADRFAVVNARAEYCFDVGKLEPAHTVGGRAPRIDSKYAAFYAPAIKIIDGATGRLRRVPPGGHVAGVYARSDVERGVWKAPANEVLRGAVGLDPEFSTADQEILNPRGVNCIRALPGRGIRVWGARTTSSDPLWRYVNVHRLFLFIEESIDLASEGS